MAIRWEPRMEELTGDDLWIFVDCYIPWSGFSWEWNVVSLGVEPVLKNMYHAFRHAEQANTATSLQNREHCLRDSLADVQQYTLHTAPRGSRLPWHVRMLFFDSIIVYSSHILRRLQLVTLALDHRTQIPNRQRERPVHGFEEHTEPLHRHKSQPLSPTPPPKPQHTTEG